MSRIYLWTQERIGKIGRVVCGGGGRRHEEVEGGWIGAGGSVVRVMGVLAGGCTVAGGDRGRMDRHADPPGWMGEVGGGAVAGGDRRVVNPRRCGENSRR